LIPVASANQDVSLTADAAFQALCDSLLTEAAANGRATSLKSSAGKLFERVAIAYLRLAPEYTHESKSPTVRRFTRWANSDLDWTGSTADKGIDLVVQTTSPAKPLPVQVKFAVGDETTQKSLKRHRLDALVAQTRVPGRIDVFGKPVIVTNARMMSTGSLDCIRDEGLISHDYDWFVRVNQSLAAKNLEMPTTLAALIALERSLSPSDAGPIEPPHTPRPHQVAALDHTQRVLEASDQTTIHMACATGKTLVSWMLMDARVQHGEVGVIFVPALSLVRDIIAAFMRQSTDDLKYEVLAVCSDTSVTSSDDEDAPEDMDVDLSTLGTSDVTSDPDVIATWLSKPSTNRRLLVATYQSSERVKEAAATSKTAFSLLIGDEAHRLVGESGIFGESIWGLTAHKRVFMTATPQVTGTLNKHTGEVKTAGMYDASRFGDQNAWFTYTTSQGVEEGILAPYHVSIYVIHEDDVDEETGVIATAINRAEDAITHGGISRRHRSTNARMAVIASQCVKSMRDTRNGRGISLVFFSKIAESKAFLAFMNDRYPDVPSAHVDGTINTRERSKTIRRIKATGGVLTNARVLNEGVDIQALGTVIFGTPKSSKVDIVQGVGRALRRDPENPDKVSEIIIPVILPSGADDSDLDALIGNTAFAALWSTVKALADNDNTILNSLIVMKNPSLAGTSDGAGGRYPSLADANSAYSNVVTLNVAGHRLNEVLAAGDGELLSRFADSISTRMLRNMGGDWMTRYAEVRGYMTEHGRAPSGTDRDPVVKRLGYWCDRQCAAKRNGNLSSERFERLNAIPGWRWWWEKDHDAVWEENCSATEVYAQEYGRMPSVTDSDSAVKRLGQWCGRQRLAKRNGNLSSERFERIDAIPGWWWEKDHDAVWEENCSANEAYVQEYGRMPNSHDRDPAVKRLGQWCGGQCAAKRNGNLSSERFERLDAIPGWSWGRSVSRIRGNQTPWEEICLAVEVYVGDYDLAPNQTDSDPVVKRLGRWCRDQCAAKRNGNLSSERFERLDAIPGWSWGSQIPWEESCSATETYAQEHGRTPSVTDSDSVVRRLGQWCQNQRIEKRTGTLSTERFERLDAIPGWSWGRSRVSQGSPTPWEESCSATEDYVIEHGRTPSSEDSDPVVKRLGRWCSKQRMSKRAGTLSAERIARLESIPGWWWEQA